MVFSKLYIADKYKELNLDIDELESIYDTVILTTEKDVLEAFLVNIIIEKKAAEYVDGKRVLKVKKQELQYYQKCKVISENDPYFNTVNLENISYLEYVKNKKRVRPKFKADKDYVVTRKIIKVINSPFKIECINELCVYMGAN